MLMIPKESGVDEASNDDFIVYVFFAKKKRVPDTLPFPVNSKAKFFLSPFSRNILTFQLYVRPKKGVKGLSECEFYPKGENELIMPEMGVKC